MTMLDYTTSDAHRDHMARMEAKMYAPGAFVMLHHACKAAGQPHEDAGRIGRIVSRDGDRMVTEFFTDDLIGSATFCLVPFGHWAAVPEFCVEEYEPRAKRRGWRLNERGVKMYDNMGWRRTKATVGAA
jgi:hypothetical protein